MKKRGMIPEKYRKSSEDKWSKIIKAIDDGKDYHEMDILGLCGYCWDTIKRKPNYYNDHNCDVCYMTVKICGNEAKKGHINSLIRCLDVREPNYTKAREYAVKIYEYIRDDKPKEMK
jgi:hypothetical protein